MASFYIAREGETLGPYTEDQVRELVRNGHLSGGDLTWQDGMKDWESLRTVLPGVEAEAGAMNRSAKESARTEEDSEKGFFSLVPGSFVYPFRGSGVIMLILGAGAMTMWNVAGVVPIVGWIVSLLITAYFTAFLFDVIRGTAMGDREMPHFPGAESIWDDVILPFFRFLFAFLFYLLPAIAYTVYTGEELFGDDELGLLLVFAGLFFVPMAILRIGVFNNVFDGLNPVAVVTSVFKVFIPYLIVLALIALLHVILEFGAEVAGALPALVSYPLLVGIGFYVMILQARLLGLIYFTKKSALGWLE